MGEGVEEGDDVRAPGMGGVRGHDLAEELDLAQRAQAEHRVVERHDLLDGHLASRRPVHGRAHNTVRALAYDIENLILRAYTQKILFQYHDRDKLKEKPLTDVEPDLAWCGLALRRRMGVFGFLCVGHREIVRVAGRGRGRGWG